MEVRLFNPSLKDFSHTYDIDGVKQTFTIPAYGYAAIPKEVATKLANRLADYLIGKHGVKVNYEADKQSWLLEIWKLSEQN
jgi:hypothetical protein